MRFQVEVDPSGEFQKAVNEALAHVDDLRPAFGPILASWFKSNRAIFSLGGPGKYADLSPAYKKQKKAKVGFVYPILHRTGALALSITEPWGKHAIARMVGKTTIEVGSSIPYGAYHQFGTKKMPKRPWILVGAEQTAPQEVNVRLQNWIKAIESLYKQKLAPLGETKG